MAHKQETHGSTKRYGTRYGKPLREKAGKLEGKYRNKLNKCPYCKKDGVKRQAAGIWFCKKCNSKFTGRAYAHK